MKLAQLILVMEGLVYVVMSLVAFATGSAISVKGTRDGLHDNKPSVCIRTDDKPTSHARIEKARQSGPVV